MEYENDASPNIEYYYSNVNYVCIKKQIEILELKTIIINIKISLEKLHSRFEIAEESGKMKQG